MLIDAIWDWNPWWSDTSKIDKFTGQPREELQHIVPFLEDSRVTIIAGVRRSGKTTLMYQLAAHLLNTGVSPSNILFIGLEDPAFVESGIDELIDEYRLDRKPDGKIYLFLDEVQSKTGWERTARKKLDIKADMKIIVSGSSSTLISGEYSTLLTGRNITHQIRPLSFRGYRNFLKGEEQAFARGTEAAGKVVEAFWAYLDTGGFPEVVLQTEEYRKITLVQYFNDILHRDIVHLHAADPRKINLMASYLILNVGNQFSLSSLRRALGLSFDAIRDYIRFLEQAGLFCFIREFSFSPKPAPREAGKMKVYCVDVGMAKAVHGRHSRDYGRFAENVVCNELLRRGMKPGFFRDKNEIDFVTATDSGISLINVCMARDIPEREFKGMHGFMQRYPKLLVKPLILTDNKEGDSEGIILMPAWKWLLETPDYRMQ